LHFEALSTGGKGDKKQAGKQLAEKKQAPWKTAGSGKHAESFG
jgi:hypothetical protein